MAEDVTTRKKKHDWEAIQRDYRTNRFTLAQLGDKYGINPNYLGRAAKARGWDKDLREAIGHATNAAIIKDVVAERLEKDVDVVLAAAEVNRAVVASHRGALGKVRKVADKLLDEAEKVTDLLAGVDEAVLNAALEQAGASPDQLAAVMRSTTLTRRLDAMSGVAQALAKLIPLERSTYGIGDEREQDDSFESWLKRRTGNGSSEG